MRNEFPEVFLIIAASTFIILLLGGLVIISLFIGQKRKFQHMQQLEAQRKSFDQEITQARLEIQQETFASISRDLHDHVSNTLSVAILNLNLIGENVMEETAARLRESKSLLLEATKAVRDYSWSIHPENIAGMFLHESLRILVSRHNAQQLLRVSLQSEGEKFALNPDNQLIIYRIIQEALSNIMKHSGGSGAFVNLKFARPCLQITIGDNGKGFETNGSGIPAGRRGSGLKNMMDRSKMIGASFGIASSPGTGTLITISYREREAE